MVVVVVVMVVMERGVQSSNNGLFPTPHSDYPHGSKYRNKGVHLKDYQRWYLQ